MSATTGQMLPKVLRWLALLVAWLALALAMMGYLNNFRGNAFPRWSASEATVLPFLGALGAAICLSEWLRNSKSVAVGWPITKHLVATGLFFLVAFAVQYVVVWLVLASHVT